MDVSYLYFASSTLLLIRKSDCCLRWVVYGSMLRLNVENKFYIVHFQALEGLNGAPVEKSVADIQFLTFCVFFPSRMLLSIRMSNYPVL